MVEGVEGRFVDLGQMDDASFKASTRGHRALKLPLALLQKRNWTSEDAGNFAKAAISSLDDLKE